MSPGIHRTRSGSSRWLLCLASIFPPLENSWATEATLLQILFFYHEPQMSLHSGMGGCERTWGSFLKTELGVTKMGGAGSPCPGDNCRRETNGRRDSGSKRCNNYAVPFSFSLCDLFWLFRRKYCKAQRRSDLPFPGLVPCLLVLGNQGTILCPHNPPPGLM